MIPCTAYDTKLYDRDHLAQAPDAERIAWRFREFLLSAETASAANRAHHHRVGHLPQKTDARDLRHRRGGRCHRGPVYAIQRMNDALAKLDTREFGGTGVWLARNLQRSAAVHRCAARFEMGRLVLVAHYHRSLSRSRPGRARAPLHGAFEKPTGGWPGW